MKSKFVYKSKTRCWIIDHQTMHFEHKNMNKSKYSLIQINPLTKSNIVYQLQLDKHIKLSYKGS